MVSSARIVIVSITAAATVMLMIVEDADVESFPGFLACSTCAPRTLSSFHTLSKSEIHSELGMEVGGDQVMNIFFC